MLIQKKFISCVLFVLFLGLSGCFTIEGTLRPPTLLPENGNFEVGAARVEITPPPGYPLGGYGPAGSMGRGYWTRLYARAIFLQDESGKRLVLVSGDLWSISGGLADKVAEGLDKGPCSVSRESIIIAATHTHHSPGSFSTHPMYNQLAAFAPGFDKRYFYFLVGRIQTAIAEACKNSEEATIYFGKGNLENVIHNRSMPAFVHNREVGRHFPNPGNPNWHSYLENLQGVLDMSTDPSIHILEFRQKESLTKTIAIAGFFSVHNTVLHPHTPVYNSDLYGIARLKTEKALHGNGRPDHPLVVALFPGAQGDMGPNTPHRDRRDALDLSEKIKNKIVNELRSHLVLLQSQNLKISYSKEDITGICLPADYDGNGSLPCTDDGAVPGTGMVGGAEAGRSFAYYLGFVEGVKRDPPYPHHPQGNKLPASLFIFPLLNPAFYIELFLGENKVPRQAPLGLYRIGDVVLATLPGEFTKTMGQRIGKALKRKLNSDDHILLIGLANEYISYFTTPEEYQQQHYEGASTLYGKASGPVIQWKLEKLVSKEFRLQNRAFEYEPGDVEEFGADHLPLTNPRPWWGLEKLLIDRRQYPNLKMTSPYFCWEDSIPKFPNPRGKNPGPGYYKNVRMNPDVFVKRIENSLAHNEDDDKGLNFITTASRIVNESSVVKESSMEWCVFWLHDLPASATSPESFQFQITPLREPGPLCSKPFGYKSFIRRIEPGECIPNHQ